MSIAIALFDWMDTLGNSGLVFTVHVECAIYFREVSSSREYILHAVC